VWIKKKKFPWKYQLSLVLSKGCQGTRGGFNQSRITESSMCGHQLFYISKMRSKNHVMVIRWLFIQSMELKSNHGNQMFVCYGYEVQKPFNDH
jgi:hypothetical protein